MNTIICPIAKPRYNIFFSVYAFSILADYLYVFKQYGLKIRKHRSFLFLVSHMKQIKKKY